MGWAIFRSPGYESCGPRMLSYHRLSGVAFLLRMVFWALCGRRKRLSDAAVSYEKSLRFWLVDDIPSGEFKPMVGLADVAAAVGLPEHAARLLGAVDHILATSDGALELFDLPAYERATTASYSALGPSLFATRHLEGRWLAPEELLAEAGAIVAATDGID